MRSDLAAANAPLERFLANRAALWRALDGAIAHLDNAATHPAIRRELQARAREVAFVLKGIRA